MSADESQNDNFLTLLETMEKRMAQNTTVKDFKEDIDLMLKLTDKALFALDKLEADIAKYEAVQQ
jgi:hypothetical protein